MDSEPDLRRIQFFALINSALGIEYLFAPVMTVFYMNYVGLSFSGFSFFIASIFILNMILEVPTGVLSDAVGRKRAYLLAGVFYLGAMLILLFLGESANLLAVLLCFSIGATLSSGNLDAIIFEQFSQCGQREGYLRITSRMNTVALLSSAFCAVAGAYLAMINIALPLLIDAVLFFVGLVLAWLFLPADRQHMHDPALQSLRSKAIGIVRSASQVVLGTPALICSIMASALIFAAVRGAFNVYQPLLLKSFELPVIGWLFAGFSLFAAYASWLFSRRAITLSGSRLFLVLVPGLTAVAGLIVLLPPSAALAAVGAIILHQCVRGVGPQLMGFLINKQIPENHEARTTVLSLEAFCAALLAAGMTGIVGQIASSKDYDVAFSAASIMGGLGALLCICMAMRSAIAKTA